MIPYQKNLLRYPNGILTGKVRAFVEKHVTSLEKKKLLSQSARAHTFEAAAWPVSAIAIGGVGRHWGLRAGRDWEWL